uniref:Uncharacterized protein n=1 Tax=Plectus sambesii TaxID=2011161 RepID=A0A914UST0_9BILA
MKCLRDGITVVLVLYLSNQASGQLAAVYSNVSQTSDCANWSSWGSCVWLAPTSRDRTKAKKGSVPYLAQLTPACQDHWFYKFVKERYETAINNFFTYMADITLSDEACGMCSYKQSCGYGGKKQCNVSPFTIRGGRSVTPFYVAERVCNERDLGGRDQHESCIIDYDKALENGAECKMWPAKNVSLPGVEPAFQDQIKKLNWSNCIAVPKEAGTSKTAKASKEKVCRCCCYPFQPNPKTLKCEHIKGAPEAPGM